MKVLVICDDYYHPAKVVRDGLAVMGDDAFQFDIIENAAAWSAAKMADYPVVLFAKSNDISAAEREPWVTDEVEAAFAGYVQAGGGLLAVHSGTASYTEKPVLRALLGGVFTHHPKQCPVTVEPKAGHPLVAGVESFTLKDEHYHMALDDKDADVFMTTTSEHGTQPGGWTRQEGEGRVCVLTPGHNVEVWQHPSFQTLLRNTLNWCAGSD